MHFARFRTYYQHPVAFAFIVAIIATVVAEGFYASRRTQGIEHFYSDAWHRVAGVQHAPEHVALVMIDDPSLYVYPDEPLVFWTHHFATALETLRQVGAKTVAIDFIFSVSPARWMEKLGPQAKALSRDYDRMFRQQLNRGSVVLTAYLVGDGSSTDHFILPSPDYLLALPGLDMVRHIGMANLLVDADSVVRRLRVGEASGELVEREGLPTWGFGALAAAMASGQDVHGATFQFGKTALPLTQSVPIAYAGPPGSFKAVSFEKLLRPNALDLPEVKALANKVVVIGTGYAGANDVHPTPYSTTLGTANALMPGPEVQANIIETLLSGRFIVETSMPVRLATFLAIFGLAASLGVRLAPLYAVAMVFLMVLFTTVIGYQLFRHDYLFPVAHLHIGLSITLLALVLMRLTREVRERARLGSMFGRFVSPQVMQALLSSPEMPELGGQSKEVSVLFADIRNFTTISEKLAAREVVEMLNTYFARACAALLAEGATIDKFIGDAIMAEFGAPLSQPDHARRALRAAIALKQVALEFSHWMEVRFGDRQLPAFEIGIGVHSGDAVVGNIGSSVRMEYTAIGDTVNIAARLEDKTKEAHCVILASRETVALAGPGIDTGLQHSYQIKGRSQPVVAFEIIEIR